MWAERRAPLAPAWLLILALHAAVVLLWQARTVPLDSPRAWTELRIIPTRPPEAPVEPSHPPREASLPAAHLPASPIPIDIEPPSAADALQPPAIEPPQELPPLRLTLPSDLASRPLALDDPRGNTPISRFGARIANDLGGDGRWVEERMDADFVRLRRGNTCINLHRNRTAGRQPFDEASAPTPWGATPAYRCERR